MRRAAAGAAVLAVAASVAVPVARAATYAAEHTRAVAYWYLPAGDEGVYRMYRAEVVSARNLATGEVSAWASIVTDRCTERWITRDQMALACADGRRERTTRDAALHVSSDLSWGTARIRVGGKMHVVHFEGPPDPETGAYETYAPCSETGHRLVAGTFANMERAHGRVLGKRLDGPYSPGLDHAWLTRGFGAWCD